MRSSRRNVLKAFGGLAAGGLGGTDLSSAGRRLQRHALRVATSTDVGMTLTVTDDLRIAPFSNEVVLRPAPDPAGRPDREDVVQVASDGRSTNDYAFSLVDVRDQGLELQDVETLTYDWYVTERNTAGTTAGVGPDEVWLLLGGEEPNRRREVFRTLNEDRGTGTWHTRDVHTEFAGLERSPWKRLSIPDRAFVEVTADLLADYGQADVLAVGIGRGDPLMGPSTIQAYYDELVLNGETYAFPTTGSRLGRAVTAAGRSTD